MAFKKKTGEAKQKGQKSAMDIRVFAAIMVVAFVVMAVMIGFGVKNTKQIQEEIEKEKKTYVQNQTAIDNLKALQSKSSEYEAQREAYNAMIPETQDLKQIMIDIEKRTEENGCVLTDIKFEEAGEAAQASAGLVKEQKVNVSLRGSYADILKLQQSLTKDNEFMRIDDIHMSAIGEGQMEAQFMLVKFSKK